MCLQTLQHNLPEEVLSERMIASGGTQTHNAALYILSGLPPNYSYQAAQLGVVNFSYYMCTCKAKQTRTQYACMYFVCTFRIYMANTYQLWWVHLLIVSCVKVSLFHDPLVWPQPRVSGCHALFWLVETTCKL